MRACKTTHPRVTSPNVACHVVKCCAECTCLFIHMAATPTAMAGMARPPRIAWCVFVLFVLVDPLPGVGGWRGMIPTVNKVRARDSKGG